MLMEGSRIRHSWLRNFGFLLLMVLCTVIAEKNNHVPDGCTITQIIKEKVKGGTLSFDAFFSGSTLNLQVTNGNQEFTLFLNDQSIASYDGNGKPTTKLISRRMSAKPFAGWTNFTLTLTDKWKLEAGRFTPEVTGVFESTDLMIDSTLETSVHITGMPMTRNCWMGGPTVQVAPENSMDILVGTPELHHHFTIHSSQHFCLQLYVESLKVTIICGEGETAFTLSFSLGAQQTLQVFLPYSKVVKRLGTKFKDAVDLVSLSFKQASKDLQVTYNLPWNFGRVLPHRIRPTLSPTYQEEDPQVTLAPEEEPQVNPLPQEEEPKGNPTPQVKEQVSLTPREGHPEINPTTPQGKPQVSPTSQEELPKVNPTTPKEEPQVTLTSQEKLPQVNSTQQEKEHVVDPSISFPETAGNSQVTNEGTVFGYSFLAFTLFTVVVLGIWSLVKIMKRKNTKNVRNRSTPRRPRMPLTEHSSSENLVRPAVSFPLRRGRENQLNSRRLEDNLNSENIVSPPESVALRRGRENQPISRRWEGNLNSENIVRPPIPFPLWRGRENQPNSRLREDSSLRNHSQTTLNATRIPIKSNRSENIPGNERLDFSNFEVIPEHHYDEIDEGIYEEIKEPVYLEITDRLYDKAHEQCSENIQEHIYEDIPALYVGTVVEPTYANNPKENSEIVKAIPQDESLYVDMGRKGL